MGEFCVAPSVSDIGVASENRARAVTSALRGSEAHNGDPRDVSTLQ